MFVSDEFIEFTKIFDQNVKDLGKIVDESKVLSELRKFRKDKIFNEIKENKVAQKSELSNPFLFLCLLEKFKFHEIAVLFANCYKLQENFLHFYFMFMLENQKALDLRKNKTFIDRKNNFSLCIMVNGVLRDPIRKYILKFKYIRNIFLLEPKILFNINVSPFYDLSLKSMEDKLKKIEIRKKSFDYDFLSNDNLRPIFNILINKQKELSKNLEEAIENDKTFKHYHKNVIKPLFLLVSRISEIAIDVEKQDVNSKFLKRIVDSY